jgi:low temperature requirement protein LtrA
MRIRRRKVQAPGGSPVTMLELFFDLVFVFVITQITTLVTDSNGVEGYGQAALVLLVTWWMYDGFAWLANNVPPTTTATRLPMLVAMTCFLAMAAVVPSVFGAGAWIFAGAYIVVVTLHAVQFSRSSLGSSSTAIRRVLPVNYGVCVLLVVAAVLGPDWGWVGWVGAVLVLLSTLVVRPEGSFSIRSEHFVERHQLLVIIALGETIIAAGVSVQGDLTRPLVLVAFVLAMVLISGLWWVYFGSGDDQRGLHALEAAPPEQRPGLCIRAYGHAHLLHIAGLVLVAAGLHEIVHDPVHHLTWSFAITASGGVAAFLLAQAAFRRVMGTGPAGSLVAAAVLALALTPVGVLVAGLGQLIGLAAVTAGSAALLARRAGAEAADPVPLDG